MAEPLRCLSPDSIIAGWDFSTGSVKALAFDVQGNTLAEYRGPTDLWTEYGVNELSLMQLEGQARASYRGLVAKLGPESSRKLVAAGISATHHTAGRIDEYGNQVRRAICWNDQTLAKYHAIGLARLGGQERVTQLIGGPWAVRYTLSHLVKDEEILAAKDWHSWMLPHGPLAAGYFTGQFRVISISSAASTGMLDLRTAQWRREMLEALVDPQHRDIVWSRLPTLIDMNTPVGQIGAHFACEPSIQPGPQPWIFPTLDDQAAGLVGGGAVDPGHVAVILGNSAVVNSSSDQLPKSGTLDAMRLNWGPYLWMRCYSNGAQFLDKLVGAKPDWSQLEIAARQIPPGANGHRVMPFVLSEPSIGIHEPHYAWHPHEPAELPNRVRAAFEALSYLIALGIREHEAAGQKVTRISVSGGIAQNTLMCEILASVLNRSLERLVSNEGTALGAAVTALAGMENHLRKAKGIEGIYTVGDAVATMVRFREPVAPNNAWISAYARGLQEFQQMISS